MRCLPESTRRPSSIPSAKLGKDVALGPYVVIGAGAVIGARSRIDAHVSIAAGAEIGEDALILAGARIGRNVRIGARFMAHSGVVIGADGFSFVTPEKSSVEAVRETLGDAGEAGQGQAWLKIHSLGGVEIGDDVEIGANSSIDAGTIRATRIGDGTKLDKLVQVGHNVQVGRNCLLCAHVAVAGSARIGDNVVLGGQVGVADNISLGDDVVAGGATQDPVERAGGPCDSGLSGDEDGNPCRGLQGAAPTAAAFRRLSTTFRNPFQRLVRMTK